MLPVADALQAFMECGEKADKGDQQMAECLPQVGNGSAVNACQKKT